MPIWPTPSRAITRRNCAMGTTLSMVKKYSLFPIPPSASGRPPDFLLNLVGQRQHTPLSVKKAAHNCSCWSPEAENLDPRAFLRSLVGQRQHTRFSANKAANNGSCGSPEAENPDLATNSRRFRY